MILNNSYTYNIDIATLVFFTYLYKYILSVFRLLLSYENMMGFRPSLSRRKVGLFRSIALVCRYYKFPYLHINISLFS